MVKQEMFSCPLHFPSRGTHSQTVRAERRIIPNSITIHRRDQRNQERPWMWCLNAAWTIIGISKETETYQIRGLDSHDSPSWTKKKPPSGYTWSGGRLTKKQTTSRPGYLWPEIWKDMSEASKRKREGKVWHRRTKVWQCCKNCEVFTSLIQQTRNSRKLCKMRWESWKFRCQQQCFARPEEESTGRL